MILHVPRYGSNHFEFRIFRFFHHSISQKLKIWWQNFLILTIPYKILSCVKIENGKRSVQGFFLGWISDCDSSFDADEYDSELDEDYIEEIWEDWYEEDEDYYEETQDWYDYLWLVFGYLDTDAEEN